MERKLWKKEKERKINSVIMEQNKSEMMMMEIEEDESESIIDIEEDVVDMKEEENECNRKIKTTYSDDDEVIMEIPKTKAQDKIVKMKECIIMINGTENYTVELQEKEDREMEIEEVNKAKDENNSEEKESREKNNQNIQTKNVQIKKKKSDKIVTKIEKNLKKIDHLEDENNKTISQIEIVMGKDSMENNFETQDDLLTATNHHPKYAFPLLPSIPLSNSPISPSIPIPYLSSNLTNISFLQQNKNTKKNKFENPNLKIINHDMLSIASHVNPLPPHVNPLPNRSTSVPMSPSFPISSRHIPIPSRHIPILPSRSNLKHLSFLQPETHKLNKKQNLKIPIPILPSIPILPPPSIPMLPPFSSSRSRNKTKTKKVELEKKQHGLKICANGGSDFFSMNPNMNPSRISCSVPVLPSIPPSFGLNNLSFFHQQNNNNRKQNLYPPAIGQRRQSQQKTYDFQNKNMMNWTIEDVSDFLSFIDLAHYSDLFKRQNITGKALKRGLKKEHLVRLGIDEWYQDILWDAIEQWRKFA